MIISPEKAKGGATADALGCTYLRWVNWLVKFESLKTDDNLNVWHYIIVYSI